MAPVSGVFYLAGFSLSAAVCAFMGYLAASHRERRGAAPFGALVGCLFIWALTEAAGLAATGLATMVLIERLQYVAVPFVAVSLLVMAVRYTGHETYISRTTLSLLMVVPVLSVGVMLTNPYHGLFWTSTRVVDVAPFSALQIEYGTWYIFQVMYSYLLITVGSATLVHWAVTAEQTYRRQARFMLVGIAVPWAANAAKQAATAEFPVDPTPVFFTVSGVFIGIAILRFQFLDLAPVARNTVVEMMREGLLVIDDQERIVDVNPAAEELLGDGNPVGNKIDDVAPGALADACLGPPGSETVTLTTPKAKRTYEIRRSILPGGAGMVLLYDVTERRRQAEQLERQNERLERFGSVLSHDLRNPLNVAHGYVTMLTDETTGEPAGFAERALDGLERMDELIDDTLRLTSEGPAVTDPEPVDLAAIASEAWQSVETTDAALELDIDRTVFADPERLQRLFENLFRNAVEHSDRTEPSGAVGQETAMEELTVRVEPVPSGFAVADNGPGIPEEQRESALEFGFTTTEDGTGLGLSIVAEIAEAHGWRVDVAESDTGGARFVFRGTEPADGRETP